MVTFYFDTSAINHLCNDIDSSFLLDKIKRYDINDNFKIQISVLTFAEIAATKQKERRVNLLELSKKILGEYRPVTIVPEILKRSIEAIKFNRNFIDLSISEDNWIWSALNNPRLIEDKVLYKITEWKEQQEKCYQDMHEIGRFQMQKIIAGLSNKEKSSLRKFSTFIKFLYSSYKKEMNDSILTFASEFADGITVDMELVQRIIKYSDHWRFWLLSNAYGIYVRSIKNCNFSKEKNPNNIDIQQATYLSGCNIFVTADIQQYRMFRLLLPFSNKTKEIWLYKKFAEWLEIQTKSSLSRL